MCLTRVFSVLSLEKSFKGSQRSVVPISLSPFHFPFCFGSFLLPPVHTKKTNKNRNSSSLSPNSISDLWCVRVCFSPSLLPDKMGQQNLIYSFVARGTVILAEYTEFKGNFTSVAAQCLQKLPSSNNKFTYNCDGHTFNYLVENGFSESLSSLHPYTTLVDIDASLCSYCNPLQWIYLVIFLIFCSILYASVNVLCAFGPSLGFLQMNCLKLVFLDLCFSLVSDLVELLRMACF